MKSSVHVLISGKVQGVFFRANTKQKAEMLGLSGWVRNTKDGKVEAMFEGEEEKLDEIIKWCYKGSPLSKVEKVDVKKQNPINEFDNFSIRY
jgi:acylphosphatase